MGPGFVSPDDVQMGQNDIVFVTLQWGRASSARMTT